MEATILFPHDNYTGNLLWNKAQAADRTVLRDQSLLRLREMGYWASPYPGGDGVTFKDNSGTKTAAQILDDFRTGFTWLDISVGQSQDSNLELARLEPTLELPCIVIVPLERIFIEESFDLGEFKFVCPSELDEAPDDRLSDFPGQYLQFRTTLLYRDLLSLNKTLDHNNFVINKCLALAEHAMDIIRFQFSSFARPEFTPNPAGQLDDGTYAIEIIPEGQTHLKAFALRAISRPMSVSNNWLGPEVADQETRGRDYLIEVMGGRKDALALSVKSAMRACRQSFYSEGSESRFLNLVFALDGLASPGHWKGWKHRTYMAALLSGGKETQFSTTLKRYDELYNDVRNRLVHGGADFYELPVEPNEACQEMFAYVSRLVDLIEEKNFTTIAELREYASALLVMPNFATAYTSIINEVSTRRGITLVPKMMPTW